MQRLDGRSERALPPAVALDIWMVWGINGGRNEHRTEFSIAALGSLLITSGRISPVALSYVPMERITVDLC